MAGRRDVEAGSAYVRLYMQQTAFQRGIRALRRDLKTIGQNFTAVGRTVAVAGAAITGTILGAAKSFAIFGDTLNKMAIRTGVSVEALSELKFAAEQSGTTLETVEKGIRKMQQAIGEAGQGTSTYVDALSNIGLSFDQLNGMTLEDQFGLIAERIAGISDPTLRAAAALEIFGKSGTQLLPLMTGDVKKLREEARKLGITMTGEDAQAAADLTDAMNRMWKASESAFMKIGAAAAPVLTDLADKIVKIAVDAQKWIETNRGLVVTALKVGAVLLGLGTTLIGVGQVALGASAAIGFLNSSMLFLAANPVAATLIAITIALGALTYAIDQSQIGSVGLSSAHEEELKKADKLRRGYDKLTDAMKRTAQTQIKSAILEAQGNMQALTDELQRLEDSWMTNWGKSAAMAGVEAQIDKQRAKIDALLARYRALQAGDVSALSGTPSSGADSDAVSGSLAAGGDEAARIAQANQAILDDIAQQRIAMIEDEKERAIAAINARYDAEKKKAEELGSSLALVEAARTQALLGTELEFARRKRDEQEAEKTREEEEKKRNDERMTATNQQLQDDTKRLQIEGSTTDEKERQRRLLEFERSISLRDAGATGASVENINAYYDARLANIGDAVAKTAASISPTGTFSSSAASAMSGRSGPTERIVKGIERLIGVTEEQTTAMKAGFSFT